MARPVPAAVARGHIHGVHAKGRYVTRSSPGDKLAGADQERLACGRRPERLADAIAAHEGVFEKASLTYKEAARRSAPSGDANQGAAEAGQARKTPSRI
ncbi:hypothetical protein BAY59_12405 [Prauserella coralliicola]|nr:hypothetical protein BAY59_12405 [Prauserella coralliicola]